MRKAIPYVATGPDSHGVRARNVVADSPTRATRRIYHEGSMVGLRTIGAQKVVIPIRMPYDGNGSVFPAFPKVLPSNVVFDGTVAPSTIGRVPSFITKPIIVAINNFSPIRHAVTSPMTAKVPPRAVKPRKQKAELQLHSRGTGGNYTIPSPLNAPQYPTSSDYLASRMIR